MRRLMKQLFCWCAVFIACSGADDIPENIRQDFPEALTITVKKALDETAFLWMIQGKRLNIMRRCISIVQKNIDNSKLYCYIRYTKYNKYEITYLFPALHHFLEILE